MLIGVVDVVLQREKLWDRIRLAKNSGFDAIELFCGPVKGKSTLWQEKTLRDTFFRKLKKETSEFKTVHAHAAFFNYFDPTYISLHPLCKKICFNEITWAMNLVSKFPNGGIVTFHNGWFCYGKNSYERRESLCEALIKLEKEAEKLGVNLGAENVDYFMPLNHFELLEYLNLRHVGITLDTGHAFLKSAGIDLHKYEQPAYTPYTNLQNFVNHFREKVVHVHLHDYRPEKKDHLPLSQGIIDFSSLFLALRATGFQGTLSLEIDNFTSQLIKQNQLIVRRLWNR